MAIGGTDSERGLQVSVKVRGDVVDEVRSYAADQVARAAAHSPARVLQARAELHQHRDPRVERPALATALVDVNGHPVRVHAASASMREAVDLMAARLRRRLAVLHERLVARQRFGAGQPIEGEWQHGDTPARRGPFFPRPPEEREIVRRRAYGAEPMSIEEAMYELGLIDGDFLLFVEAGTGVDTLLFWPPAGGWPHVRQVTAGTPEHPAAPLVVESRPAPQIALEVARERMDVGDEPFVFFRDPATGRGSVLYRRLDGHYGLVAPAP